jgi:hypothetical protein
VLRKVSALTLNNSLPVPTAYSHRDSVSGLDLAHGIMSEQHILSFDKKTFVSIHKKTEPYLQTIDVHKTKSGIKSNLIPTFKDVFN